MAGAKALAEAGIDPARVGLMINSSVSRAYLEPSSAVAIHHQLGLPTSCMNFDLANACLGFVNAMHVAATMIDAGHIEYALVVDGEDARYTQEATIARLEPREHHGRRPVPRVRDADPRVGRGRDGPGPADRHPGAHRLIGGVARSATEHHELCVGNLEQHEHRHQGAHGRRAWTWPRRPGATAAPEHGWGDVDCYVIHQVSSIHTRSLCERLGIDPSRVPLTFPTLGNVGPASVPITLARQVRDAVRRRPRAVHGHRLRAEHVVHRDPLVSRRR